MENQLHADISPQFKNCINAIDAEINNPDSNSYAILMAALKNMIQNLYNQALQRNETDSFINYVLTLVKSYKGKVSYVILNAFLQIQTKDKMSIADRISLIITQFDPTGDVQENILVRDILLYLSYSLRNSFTYLFSQLCNKMLEFNPQYWMKRLEFLQLIFKSFPQYISLNHLRNSIAIITYILKQPYELSLMSIAIKLWRTVLPLCKNYGIYDSLINQPLLVLTNSSLKRYDGIVSYFEILLKYYPRAIENIELKELPMKQIDHVDPDKKPSAFIIIPLIIKLNEDLFLKNDESEKKFFEYLNLIHSHVTKKTPFRDDALLSIGNTLFYKKNIVTPNQIELINKIYYDVSLSSIFESDSECYAFMSLLKFSKNIKKDCMKIFTYHLSDLIISGLVLLKQDFKKDSDFYFTCVTSMADKIIFDKESSDKEIVMAFQLLIELDFPLSFINQQSLLKYNNLAYHSSLEIRESTILYYIRAYNKNGSPDILKYLLSFVLSEMNQQLRSNVIPQLNISIFSESMFYLFTSLLYDPFQPIRISIYKYLLKNIANDEVKHILEDFICEKIEDMKQTQEINKEYILYLSLLSCIASENQEPELSQNAKAILQPHIRFLIQILMNRNNRISSTSLSLLSMLIKISPSEFDMNKLVELIGAQLVIQSSRNKLNSTLALLENALSSTNMRETIYSTNSSLIYKIIQLAKLHSSDIDYEKLVSVLSLIGPVNTQYINELFSRENPIDEESFIKTVNIFLSKYEKNEPFESLIFASVGVAVSNIIDILSNDSLVSMRDAAIDTLSTIFKSNRKTVPLEKELVSQINNLLNTDSMQTITSILKSIPVFQAALGNSFDIIIPKIATIICEKWKILDKSALIRITEWLVLYLPDYILPKLPNIVATFVSDFDSYDVQTVKEIISAFVSFGVHISLVDHIVYPVILNWLEKKSMEIQSTKGILSFFILILKNGGSQKYTGYIVRAMIQIAQNSHSGELMDSMLNILIVVAVHAGQSFLLYVPHIVKVFPQEYISQSKLIYVIKCYENNLSLPDSVTSFVYDMEKKNQNHNHRLNSRIATITNNEAKQVVKDIPKVDFDETLWITWSDGFFGNMIRNSPSRAISACVSLADRNSTFKDAITPIAIAIYHVRSAVGQSELPKIFSLVLKSQNIPKNVIKIFIQVYEILEVLQLPQELSIVNSDLEGLLCSQAVSAGLIPYALHLSETLFDKSPNDNYLTLIKLNKELGLSLAVDGVIKFVSKTMQPDQNEIARLEIWDLLNDTDNLDISLRSKYLMSYGKYDELKEINPDNDKYQAIASWFLLDKDNFIDYATKLKDDDDETYLYRIYYNILIKNYQKAEDMISIYRSKKSDLIFPMILEDYERAYDDFSQITLLQAAKEVMLYQQSTDLLESTDTIKKSEAQNEINGILTSWKLRFSLLPNKSNILHQFLCLYQIMLPPQQLHDYWIRFLNVSIEEKKFDVASLATKFVLSLSGTEKEMYSTIIQYSQGQTDEAIKRMCKLAQSIKKDEEYYTQIQLYTGNWLLNNSKFKEARSYIENVIKLDNPTPEDWQSWSVVNFELASNDPKYLVDSFYASLNGLLLSPENPLRFTLKILSIMFNNGDEKIFNLFIKKISSIPSYVWIGVLPQIIAQSNSENKLLRDVIQELLFTIGVQYPQVVMYSLMVPLKNTSSDKKEIAHTIFDKMNAIYPDIVLQIDALANEFIRVAASWWEIWNNDLDDSSRAFLFKNDANEMETMLVALHDMIHKPAETFFEISFMRQFGTTISAAEKLFINYQKTKKIEFLHSAWLYYTDIYVKLQGIIKNMFSFNLEDASPFLSSMKDLKIAVPGTFVYNKELVYIDHASEEVTIMKSKQRPRKIDLYGSNGKKYMFLLKAHEDTRLDERVMQLFAYINALVYHTSLPLKSRLSITTYQVIPLTCKVGLIGWVPSCNTLFGFIKDFKEKYGDSTKALDYEFKIAVESAKPMDYVELDGEDKYPFFMKGIKVSNADELKKVIFMNSADPSHWIERRLNYTASLATTSMSGYVLGLGDRHLQNIMMKTQTGKLVHIDFGDCFEVAQNRSAFAEKVPFRLTRMLTNALEITKIDGTLRTSMINIMSLMRENSDQIFGLLEVFKYDPLLQWMQEKDDSATKILDRIQDKLKGRDFSKDDELNVSDQVDKLIGEATDYNNLCHMFQGWYPWW